MASTEIVQLRASGEVILERKPASVPMRDKNAQESDNGTSPASDDDSEAIQQAEWELLFSECYRRAIGR